MFVSPLVIFFCSLVFFHSIEIRKSKNFSILKNLNRDSLRRITGDWMKNEMSKICQSEKNSKSSKNSNLLIDLNIIGKNSLLHYIGTIYNGIGYDILLSWLENRSNQEVIRKRQSAVQELSDGIEHRQKVQMYLHKTFNDNDFFHSNKGSYEKIINWAIKPSPDFFLTKIFYSVGSLFFITSIILLLFYLPNYTYYCLFFLLLNAFILASTRKKVLTTFNQMTQMDNELRRYSFLCKTINENSYHSEYLNTIRTQVLYSDTLPAHIQLKKLSKLIEWSDLRYGGLFYLVINFAIAYDFHIYSLLNTWKRKNGMHIQQWINACGEYEVLLSLSEIGFNNPNWNYPKVVNDENSSIKAKSMGHPLIKEVDRVDNSINVGPQGQFILVTGSNMSGKTTLLRTIGINILLSRTGSPVCAHNFELPSIDVATSFRVTDSLTKGISLFMAELQQIKNIITLVKENSKQGILSLTLLDEILQGTNSQERHLAVTHILKELINQKCIGVISTHDLDLAHSHQLKHACKPIYFREELNKINESTIMSFDYKLRSGIADTRNALKLLAAVGIKNTEGITIRLQKSAKNV